MCIYCGTKKYRKIYENHHGPIPKDNEGRTYEIHHIDGDKQNNHPDNLKCVSIQEHYDIHYSQGDWGACYLIGVKMKLSPAQLSEVATKNNRKRITAGTHILLSGKVQREQARQQLLNGTHPFMRRKDGTSVASDRVKNGTNPFCGPDNNSKRIENGTHNWLGPENNRKKLEAGTHPLQGPNNNNTRLENGTHPSQIKITCKHCGKIVGSAMYKRWHGDKCKTKLD